MHASQVHTKPLRQKAAPDVCVEETSPTRNPSD